MSSIKCFKCLGKSHIASQCPNKRTMVVLGNGDITSAFSSSSSSESGSECDIQSLQGDLLMVKRLLGSVKDRDKTQRENIFHTRRMVMGKICSLIIDGGSCTNVASQRLIEKLALKTSPHLRPYKLQWLSENGELVVDIQVLICFSIGKYVDETLFDVVPMEANHLLLGRPWQYDRNVVHNGVTNKFSFIHKGERLASHLFLQVRFVRIK